MNTSLAPSLLSSPLTTADSKLVSNTAQTLLGEFKSVDLLKVASIFSKSSSALPIVSTATFPAVDSPFQPPSVADQSENSWLDLLWQSAGALKPCQSLLELGSASLGKLSAVADADWQLRGVEDFDSNNQLDLLWYHPTTRESQIWLLDGTNLLTSVQLPAAAVGYELQATGDFNQDTSVDLLWRNPQTGKNQLWLLQGTEITLTEASVVALPDVIGSNLKIHATGDFDQDGDLDILWRNTLTGERVLWSMAGVAIAATRLMPAELGAPAIAEPGLESPELKPLVADVPVLEPVSTPAVVAGDALVGDTLIQGAGIVELAPTGSLPDLIVEPAPPTQAELLKRLIGTVPTLAELKQNPTLLPTLPILDWSIAAIGDFDQNCTVEVRLQQLNTQETLLLEAATFSQITQVLDQLEINWQVALLPPAVADLAPVKITKPIFSGAEGDAGKFQVRLTEAPTTPITLTLASGNFLVVDANAIGQDGFQDRLVFTAEDWNQPRTVSFIAELDGVSSDRLLGNWVSFSLADALTSAPLSSVTYDLGTVTNTYAPDPTAFNIDLDFRNDYSGFWTAERQAIAHQAANDWASRIANEWTDFSLDSTIGRLDSSAERAYSFNSKRYVDDLLVFVNVSASATGGEAALGGADYQFGGWVSSPQLMPRVGQIFVNPAIYANFPDQTLYQVVTHEIGHVLGLVGLNWRGYNLIDRSNPLTATFNGTYATAIYGAPIPLQSQDGGDFAHPAARVPSIMSYGYLYSLPTATELDFAMLADSGYRVRGVNYSVST